MPISIRNLEQDLPETHAAATNSTNNPRDEVDSVFFHILSKKRGEDDYGFLFLTLAEGEPSKLGADAEGGRPPLPKTLNEAAISRKLEERYDDLGHDGFVAQADNVPDIINMKDGLFAILVPKVDAGQDVWVIATPVSHTPVGNIPFFAASNRLRNELSVALRKDFGLE